MLTDKLKELLEHIRQQPDHVRLRVVIIWTLGTGAVLLLLWLAVLLPLQLYLSR